jgi:hypothetical protein
MVLVRDLGILVAGVPLVSMFSRLAWSGTQYIQQSFTTGGIPLSPNPAGNGTARLLDFVT